MAEGRHNFRLYPSIHEKDRYIIVCDYGDTGPYVLHHDSEEEQWNQSFWEGDDQKEWWPRYPAYAARQIVEQMKRVTDKAREAREWAEQAEVIHL